MKVSTIFYMEELIHRYSQLTVIKDEIIKAAEELIAIYSKSPKGKLLICGNGGSAADSLHIVGELMKSFKAKRPLSADLIKKLSSYEHGRELGQKLQTPLPAISLVCESGLNTALGNDVDPQLAFAQQVLGYGEKGDILLAISTSGNSANVVYAAETALAKGLKVIALTGKSGGKLKQIADICINVPETETFKVQELHLPVYHVLCLAAENEIFTMEKQ